ncbi:MAG: DUF6602 domain-containing protein [Acidimicrobiales bacterium]|jgi:hypothetical protein
MNTNYILGRLRSDSRHVCHLAEHEGQVSHPGVKGRFRELLMNNLLVPWLPPSVGCGTGVIIDAKQQVDDAGQDDIVLFDPLFAPPILASPQSTHGVYLFNSVLCRIEVKSTLRKEDLKRFVDASKRIADLKFTLKHGATVPDLYGAFNMLVAYESRIAAGQELDYLCEEMTRGGLAPTGGKVSAMCIAKRGFWLLGNENGVNRWKELQFTEPDDPLSYFVGTTSNSCFDQRAKRLRLDESLGGGIGLYLDHPFVFV